jgi:hypothetical protein
MAAIETIYPKDETGGVFRTRDRDGRVLYTNVPR